MRWWQKLAGVLAGSPAATAPAASVPSREAVEAAIDEAVGRAAAAFTAGVHESYDSWLGALRGNTWLQLMLQVVYLAVPIAHPLASQALKRVQPHIASSWDQLRSMVIARVAQNAADVTRRELRERTEAGVPGEEEVVRTFKANVLSEVRWIRSLLSRLERAGPQRSRL